MIDRDAPDVGGLGPKVEKPKPAPKDVEVAPGIWRSPDGKLRTGIPPPPAKPASILPPLPRGYRYAPYPFVVAERES
jgi:hypothetical protein